MKLQVIFPGTHQYHSLKTDKKSETVILDLLEALKDYFFLYIY